MEGQRLNKAEHIRETDGVLWASAAHIFHHLLSVTNFFGFLTESEVELYGRKPKMRDKIASDLVWQISVLFLLLEQKHLYNCQANGERCCCTDEPVFKAIFQTLFSLSLHYKIPKISKYPFLLLLSTGCSSFRTAVISFKWKFRCAVEAGIFTSLINKIISRQTAGTPSIDSGGDFSSLFIFYPPSQANEATVSPRVKMLWGKQK